MDINQLKDTIGDRAESTIASHFGVVKSGGTYPCRLTYHNKGDRARMTWLNGYSFHCNDCGNSYDIINLAKDGLRLEGEELFKFLNEQAGLIAVQESNPKPKEEKAPPSTKFFADFSGLPSVERICEGVTEAAREYLWSRNISDDTFLKVYGCSGDDNGLYFNYWSRGHDPKRSWNLCKVKGRKLGDIKNGKNKYHAIAGGSNIMFGAHLYNGHGRLIITEGEIDALSMHEGISFVGAQDQIMACSVPSGSSYKWIDDCEAFLRLFESIVICADSDEAGIKFKETVFLKMRDTYNVRWIDLSLQKVNDVNELLTTKGKEVVGDLLNSIEAPCHSHGLTGDRIERNMRGGYIKTGYYGLDRALQGCKLGEVTVFAGESNDGKCLHPDQEVIMYDGSLMKAKDIIEGHLLMGPDSMPRRVISTVSGVQEMFKITQHAGEDYIVNRSHILSLKVADGAGRDVFDCHRNRYSDGDIVNISIDDYLMSNKTFKRRVKGWKSPRIDFGDRSHISGDISGIPVKIERKKSTLEKKKNHLQTKISVESIGEGAYCGFQLVGEDSLFLLKDFTVTHNSTICRQIISYNARNGIGCGGVFGEETPERFMDESIRQVYTNREDFHIAGTTEWGDVFFEPTKTTEDRWKQEYGKMINLFQIDKVRNNDRIGVKIFDWMSHCVEVEGKCFFVIDNLMKITADEASDEFAAQARFIEQLYRFAQKKMVHILLVVHTKKIVGLIDQNSISGTKKIYNTPDNVLFFQRIDRLKAPDGVDMDKIKGGLMEKTNTSSDFTSYISAHKIRHRNPNYTNTIHLMEYDVKTTVTTELLSSDDFHEQSLYDDGHSRVVDSLARARRTETVEEMI